MTIKIIGIDHVVLRTRDLDSMLAFYRDTLDCPLERELPELGLTQLRAGNALIDLVSVDSELGRAGGVAPRQDGRNMDHLCLQLEQRAEQEVLDFLAARGIATERFERRYGAEGFGRSLYINDPEGNVVELKFVQGQSTPG